MAQPLGHYPPVEDFLGRETLEVLAAPDRLESYIIEVGSEPCVGFAGCTVLAEGPLLTNEQVARLKGLHLETRSALQWTTEVQTTTVHT